LNVILGTILLRILETEVTDKHIENYWKILNNLTREDIATINRFRIADWRKSLEHNYDFSNLDIYKVLALAWYNVWQNGKDTIKRWFLYALAVLA
jgi:transcription initiation factor IIE alpha subunit